MNVLVIDIGGSHVKALVSGQTEPRKFESGPALTPMRMVQGVQKITADWNYDVAFAPVLESLRDLSPGAVKRTYSASANPNQGAQTPAINTCADRGS